MNLEDQTHARSHNVFIGVVLESGIHFAFNDPETQYPKQINDNDFDYLEQGSTRTTLNKHEPGS